MNTKSFLWFRTGDGIFGILGKYEYFAKISKGTTMGKQKKKNEHKFFN